MSARLKQQLDALLPPAPAPRRPTTRELMHRIMDNADIVQITADGRVRIELDLSVVDVDDLAEWDADEREPDDDIEDVRL